jgi:ATP-dependent RNA helicase DDX35
MRSTLPGIKRRQRLKRSEPTLRSKKVSRIAFTLGLGDHITLLNVYNGFLEAKQSSRWASSHLVDSKSLIRAISIREFLFTWLNSIANTLGSSGIRSCGDDTVSIRKAVVSGFFSKAAQAVADGTFRCVRDRSLVLHIDPASCLAQRTPGWVVFHELVETDRCYMSECSVIEADWLVECASQYYVANERTETRSEVGLQAGISNRTLF